jgi:hypothetical protein
MKICKQCNKAFQPARPMQSVCSPLCAAKHVKGKKKEERETVKKRKAELQTIPDLIKLAQVEFNAFIRARDKGKPCICCGRPLDGDGIGGSVDAGHYRSTGSASHLRFNEDNCHAQSKQCNRWGAGRAVDYRIGLIERIGLERVEALENNNTQKKWTREELREIREIYKQKRKNVLQ